MIGSRLWRPLLALISRVGADPDDDEEMRLKKAVLVGTTTMVSVAALLWGLTYLYFNEPVAAAIPLSYALFSTFYLVVFGISRHFGFFRYAHFTLSLLLPFLLMLALGGYINGSAVILWAFIAPLSAILGGQWRLATYGFMGYVALVIASGLLQPYLRTENNLPFELIIAFFVVNIATVSGIALAVLVYFVKQKDLSVQLMRKNRELEQAYLQQEIMLRQSEKLATLGKLSAGMAHELNNPAAAAQRGADQLRGEISQLQKVQLELGALGLSPSQRDALAARTRLTEERARHPSDLDPLTRSDREDEIESCLEDSGVENAWEAAPMLVDMGYGPDALAELGQSFTAEQFPKVVASQSNSYATHSLLEEIGQGVGRIVEIVKALKSYSYLDQAPIQSIDVHEGLDNTLVMLRNKLKGGVAVRRDYAADLPHIQAFGSELNQVWTNIIDNAASAMEGQGELVLKTYQRDPWVVVEIHDTGPGIPEGILPQIFDPFFTTKAPGEGTGLGLNISHNIVVQKHQGEIAAHSQPGSTCFEVRLPVDFKAIETPGDAV